MWLTAVLLFVVLFFIYPLKFIMGFISSLVTNSMDDATIKALFPREDRAPLRLHRAALLVLSVATACGGGDEKRPAPAVKAAPDSAVATAAAPAGCRPDGRWHQCSVIERLDRSGLAPRLDSTAATEKPLARPGILIHVGNDELEVFIYDDEAARAADEKKLDSTQFVAPSAPLTIRRERTMIRSVNLLGLLKTLNNHKRERVSDALMAGPPQPPT